MSIGVFGSITWVNRARKNRVALGFKRLVRNPVLIDVMVAVSFDGL